MLATTRVPASQISLYYYVGFCFLMMRRYKVHTHTTHPHTSHPTQDTLRTFSNIIVFIQRAKNHFQPKSYQQLQVIKQNEQMLNIIAMVVALNPQVRTPSMAYNSRWWVYEISPLWEVTLRPSTFSSGCLILAMTMITCLVVYLDTSSVSPNP